MSFGCHTAQHEECITRAILKAEAICQEKSIQFTKVRRRVLELIWQGHKPCKAYDLLGELQKEDTSAKPATIYRALDFLQEHGLVHRVNSLNAYIGCAAPDQETPYFLFVCSSCDNVQEKEYSHYQEFFDKIFKDENFNCTNKTFEIEGICQNCH